MYRFWISNWGFYDWKVCITLFIKSEIRNPKSKIVLAYNSQRVRR